MRQWHPTHSLATLVLRSTIHSFRKLIESVPPFEKEVRKLEAKLDGLLASKPHKVTGRMMFFKDLVTNLKDRSVAQGRLLAPGLIREACRRHAATYAGLSSKLKAKYEVQGHEYRVQQAGAIDEDRVATYSLLQLARERHCASSHAASQHPPQ